VRSQVGDRFPGRLGAQIHVGDVGAAPAVVEVVEAEPVDAHVDEQVDDAREVLDICAR